VAFSFIGTKHLMTVAQQYIDDVLSGKQVVGQWIRKAIDRHVRDLKRTDIVFDGEAGERVIDFIQTFCIPSAQNTEMTLMPWQQAWIYILYGWKRLDGTRRFRRAYLEIAKKNGKTGLAAALAIYHLIADGELSARVFIAATALKQAKECFNEAVAMRTRSADLREAIHQSGNNPVIALTVPETLSRLSPMARGSDSQDGAVVSAAILDELHRWKTGDNVWSILRYGGDTRKQPMLICITTAGSSAGKSSLCWAEREYGCQILDGHIDDDEVCPFIFSLDPKDSWKDERHWIKANPSLGAILPIEALRNQLKEATGKPTSVGEYKRFRLNIWTEEAADPAIELEKWDDCSRVPLSAYPSPKKLRIESQAELAGRLCFAAVDLAPKNDTSALVLVFPPLKQGEKWRVIPYFWIPRSNIEERSKRDRVQYDRWHEEGFLTATEGDITDPRSIAQAICEINAKFDLKELAYDAAWSEELVRMLGEENFPMSKFVQFRQGHNDKMNAACNEWMRKVLTGELQHDNDPVLRWQVGNLRWNTSKTSGFIRPAKDKKREKNDGCVAMIMALGRATSPENIVKPKRQFFYVSSK
jgi:phage terminase large subunit-like protein